MLVGVRVRVWGALWLIAGCGEPTSGLPSQQVKDDLRVETKAGAERRPHPTLPGDVAILCDAATGIDAAAPDAVARWTQKVEKQLMTPQVLKLVGVLPTVVPAVKMTVLRNGAAELGVQDWSCPPLEAIFTAEAAANPEPAAAKQPLRFALGAREFTGAQAWATRFNQQRRIIVGSQATTCEELQAVPEKPKKGRVTLVVTVPWTTGKHSVATAEVIDDDTRATTIIEASDGAVELGDEVGGRRPVTLTIKGKAGSASGTIDVAPCD